VNLTAGRALARLEERLGHRFSDPALLELALTHRSHSGTHNERLEFLGDAILGCVIAILLFDRLGSRPEGELTRLRAALVRETTLAEIAQSIELGDLLQLGEGELKSGGFRRPSILADALEAVFGAVFRDAGFERARAVIEGLYASRLTSTLEGTTAPKDAKTALQEWLQGRRLKLPSYSVLDTRGEAHEQTFVVRCEVPEMEVAETGEGPSRRAAEQAAASRALEKLAHG
jgi:ribonuclease III